MIMIAMGRILNLLAVSRTYEVLSMILSLLSDMSETS